MTTTTARTRTTVPCYPCGGTGEIVGRSYCTRPNDDVHRGYDCGGEVCGYGAEDCEACGGSGNQLCRCGRPAHVDYDPACEACGREGNER